MGLLGVEIVKAAKNVSIDSPTVANWLTDVQESTRPRKYTSKKVHVHGLPGLCHMCYG